VDCRRHHERGALDAVDWVDAVLQRVEQMNRCDIYCAWGADQGAPSWKRGEWQDETESEKVLD
jgi:hypothetical protein